MLRFFIKRSLFIFALFTHSTFAGDIGTQPHTNTLSIYRETSSSVVLNFEINVSLVMRKILAPQLSHEEFLKFFITLSDEKFQKSIQIVQKDLNEKSMLSTSQGFRFNVIKWQFPSANKIRLLMSNELAFLKVPVQFQAHVDPVVIKAEIPASHAMQRARLTLPESLMPILVINGVHDKFWLSEQIPLAVLDIP